MRPFTPKALSFWKNHQAESPVTVAEPCEAWCVDYSRASCCQCRQEDFQENCATNQPAATLMAGVNRSIAFRFPLELLNGSTRMILLVALSFSCLLSLEGLEPTLLYPLLGQIAIKTPIARPAHRDMPLQV